MGALSFTSPLILAALLGLPLVWWLLRATPPAPREQRFPAFVILRKLINDRETPVRTPWPLLLLRLLLTALVIIAIAGPILNAPPTTPQTGPMLIVVDDTYAAAHGWRARRDAIAAAAAEAEQVDRPLYLLATAPRRNPRDIQPMTGEAMREAAASLTPQPFAADRAGAVQTLETLADAGPFEIRWLSDGLAGDDDERFSDALRALGDVSLFNDSRAPKPILQAVSQSPEGPVFRITRLDAENDWEGTVIAIAQDGRVLARSDAVIAAGESDAEALVELPLALRNDIARVRIENAVSAGSVHLVDARDRRALVGIVAEAAPTGDRLLSGAHYVREALAPHAEIIEDSLPALFDADVSVIVLNDIGAIRRSDVEMLTAWIEKGGVLIRFAGPILAETAQDLSPPLLPVELRGGGRAFGGALTWETPQHIDAFPSDSPFAGLAPPKDALVRRQVLATPGGETTRRSWARLQDGTPLVTGERIGAGAIALFHVTATPQWSDLPISGTFVDMLRRLAFLSALGPEGEEIDADTRYQPVRLLSGDGRFRRPTQEDAALAISDMAKEPGPDRWPGLYGSPEAPLAVNAVRAETVYEPLQVDNLRASPYVAEPPQRLAPPLFAAALILLLIDAVATLILAGKLSAPRFGAAALVLALAVPMLPATPAYAQPLDRTIDAQTADAALTTRLAYVRTGDPALDRLSAQALAGLSRELYRRTALEPGPPAAVDPETDDLSVYPFLYWPIAPGAETPSESALANIENFMRFGGLILFDTRDDERALGAGATPEAQALQRVLSQLNIPPLTTVGQDHVLTRSFYLLTDGLYGRLRNNPVWVAAETAGANDGVTPVIIGGRDWAGAWAIDSFGRPMRAMPQGGSRELAYRAGINMVMVAFTGNYKSDQVHTPILLQRLDR